MVERKNAHWSNIFCTASLASTPPSTPSHDGNSRRFCVHANCHGIARSDSTLVFDVPRRAGRLPMLISASSCSGVAARKYSRNSGVSYTMWRYSRAAALAMRSMRARHSSPGDSGGASVASSVAVV